MFLFLIFFFILNNIKTNKNTIQTLYYCFSKLYLKYFYSALSTIDIEEKKFYYKKTDDIYFILNLIKNENTDKNIKIRLINKRKNFRYKNFKH